MLPFVRNERGGLDQRAGSSLRSSASRTMPALAAPGWMAPMEQTATEEQRQRQGRFARYSAPPPPRPEAALGPASPSPPPADLAAMRAIQRRWPRTVPAKRVFPRG